MRVALVLLASFVTGHRAFAVEVADLGTCELARERNWLPGRHAKANEIFVVHVFGKLLLWLAVAPHRGVQRWAFSVRRPKSYWK
jgi:hypothetical protein